MGDAKISQLANGSPALDADELPANRSGANVKIPVSAIRPRFAENETPGGPMNGSNQTFALAYAPVSGSLRLYRNGIRLALGTDYTLSVQNLTLVSSAALCAPGDNLIADYRY